jgi:antitoxin YefM
MEELMSKQVSYSYARQNFAEILTETADTQEPVIVSRRGHEDVAILPASELRSLEETAHLMRSPANARRLLAALHRALSDEGHPESTAALRAELELE